MTTDYFNEMIILKWNHSKNTSTTNCIKVSNNKKMQSKYIQRMPKLRMKAFHRNLSSTKKTMNYKQETKIQMEIINNHHRYPI